MNADIIPSTHTEPNSINILGKRKRESDTKEPDSGETVDPPPPSTSKPPKPLEYVSLENGWRKSGSLLFLDDGTTTPSHVVIGFDMDGTLITTKSGAKFPKNTNDWKLFESCVPSVIAREATAQYDLNSSKKTVCIFSNQMGISKGHVSVTDICAKFDSIRKELKVPVQMYIATGDDNFRKPSPAMWKFMEDYHNGDDLTVDRKASLYVGDFAGRVNKKSGKKLDKASSDRMFAENLGLRFLTPEKFFLNQDLPASVAFAWNGFNPRHFLSQQQESTSETLLQLKERIGEHCRKAKLQMVMFVGPPASGKSTLSHWISTTFGYQHINQDTLGTKKKCIAATEQALKSKISCVIDNTNPDTSTRKEYISVANKLGVDSILCCQMNVSIELAKHLAAFRGKISEGKRAKLSAVAFNFFKSRFVAPQLSEGFTAIEEIPFIPTFESEDVKTVFLEFTG